MLFHSRVVQQEALEVVLLLEVVPTHHPLLM